MIQLPTRCNPPCLFLHRNLRSASCQSPFYSEGNQMDFIIMVGAALFIAYSMAIPHWHLHRIIQRRLRESASHAQ
jgi:hypothetical protein